MSRDIIGREYYREFHEFEFDPQLESGEVEEEIDLEDCPYCKWDDICKGGCRNGVLDYTPYHFEKAEEEE